MHVLELLRYIQSLWAASTVEQLERAFVAGFGRVVDAPMYGLELASRTVTANVSDAFTARYALEARDLDPVRARALASGEPAYNRQMMSAAEWERSAAYRHAYRAHRIGHVVWVPVPAAGALFFASACRPFDPAEVALGAATASVIGDARAEIAHRERVERERERALTALELTGTAMVTSDPHEPELRLNAAARGLLADVLDAEASLHELLARPIGQTDYSRRVQVELATGETGVLHVHATAIAGGLTAVVELQREQTALSPGPLTTLTARESEVARLVVDGLGDREIAERLYLSRHTVSQHLKRVYRKLDVDSRVSLTRLLLGAVPMR
jgi:DNA-binding CsgD family transcriptional regulator